MKEKNETIVVACFFFTSYETGKKYFMYMVVSEKLSDEIKGC